MTEIQPVDAARLVWDDTKNSTKTISKPPNPRYLACNTETQLPH